MTTHTHATLAQVSFTAPDSGFYVVVASSGSPGNTGTYQLSATGLPEQGKQLRYAKQPQAQQQGDTFTVNWPSELVGYILQWNSVLEPTGWEDIGVITDNGLNARIVVPIEPGSRFFRLRAP